MNWRVRFYYVPSMSPNRRDADHQGPFLTLPTCDHHAFQAAGSLPRLIPLERCRPWEINLAECTWSSADVLNILKEKSVPSSEISADTAACERTLMSAFTARSPTVCE